MMSGHLIRSNHPLEGNSKGPYTNFPFISKE